MQSAPRAAVGAVGTGVLAGAMRFGALPMAQAAPAIASPPDPGAADLARAAPTSARLGTRSDTNDFATNLNGEGESDIYLADDDHWWDRDHDCHWWDPATGSTATTATSTATTTNGGGGQDRPGRG